MLTLHTCHVTIVTDNFSGPDKSVGPLRVSLCLCDQVITLELNDLSPITIHFDLSSLNRR